MTIDTTARDMHPPVVIYQCPGAGGHEWAGLNPKWYSDGRVNLRERRWCSEHHEERDAHIQKSLHDAAIRRALAYGELPLPESKKCANPDPTTHPVGAVLPARKFYRRRGKGVNRDKPTLDSRCKDCRVEETKMRRSNLTPEQEASYRAARRAWSKAARERKRRGRRQFERERDKELPVGPLRRWLEEEACSMSHGDLMAATGVDAALFRRIREDESKPLVRLSVVDRIGMGLGRIDLVDYLYPIDQESRAA